MSTTGTTTGNTSTTTADAAKGAASEVAGEASSAAADVKDTVKTEVGSVVSDAADKAGSVLRTSQDELRSQAESKAKDLSSTLDTAARQLSSMADAADDPSSMVAQLSRTAAEQLRKQGQRLEQGGLEGLASDAKRFARNRPGAFMLGSIAAGFAVGRLAKHANVQQVVDSAKQELTGGGSSSQPQQGSTSIPSTSPLPSTVATLPSAGSTPPVGGAHLKPEPIRPGQTGGGAGGQL